MAHTTNTSTSATAANTDAVACHAGWDSGFATVAICVGRVCLFVAAPPLVAPDSMVVGAAASVPGGGLMRTVHVKSLVRTYI